MPSRADVRTSPAKKLAVLPTPAEAKAPPVPQAEARASLAANSVADVALAPHGHRDMLRFSRPLRGILSHRSPRIGHRFGHESAHPEVAVAVH